MGPTETVGGQQDAAGQRSLSRGIRIVIRNEATAFSYSVLITATFGITDLLVGTMSVARLFLFILGATGAFAVFEALASRFFRVRLRGERSDVVLLGTAMAPVAVSVSLGAAAGILTVVGGTAGWFAAPATSTSTYLLVAGVQVVLARLYQDRHHPPQGAG